ncbi:MAG: hypothetical protein Q7R96_03080 [Nanoarchaeota archaeon]|nr:hypothetical protein [Nanoarchaeota archaeon]
METYEQTRLTIELFQRIEGNKAIIQHYVDDLTIEDQAHIYKETLKNIGGKGRDNETVTVICQEKQEKFTRLRRGDIITEFLVNNIPIERLRDQFACKACREGQQQALLALPEIKLEHLIDGIDTTETEALVRGELFYRSPNEPVSEEEIRRVYGTFFKRLSMKRPQFLREIAETPFMELCRQFLENRTALTNHHDVHYYFLALVGDEDYRKGTLVKLFDKHATYDCPGCLVHTRQDLEGDIGRQLHESYKQDWKHYLNINEEAEKAAERIKRERDRRTGIENERANIQKALTTAQTTIKELEKRLTLPSEREQTNNKVLEEQLAEAQKTYETLKTAHEEQATALERANDRTRIALAREKRAEHRLLSYEQPTNTTRTALEASTARITNLEAALTTANEHNERLKTLTTEQQQNYATAQTTIQTLEEQLAEAHHQLQPIQPLLAYKGKRIVVYGEHKDVNSIKEVLKFLGAKTVHLAPGNDLKGTADLCIIYERRNSTTGELPEIHLPPEVPTTTFDDQKQTLFNNLIAWSKHYFTATVPP